MAVLRMPAADFVRELEAAYGRRDGYIMGAYGQNPRTGSLDLNETAVKASWRTGGWYYTQYSGKQLTQALKWRASCQRVWDCNGLAEGIYQLYAGECINSKARYNYRDWCGVKGTGMIPPEMRVPGAAVFWGKSADAISHVAYLDRPVKAGSPEGDWYLIEARGVMDGVVRTKLISRRPGYWGYMDKYFDYSGAPAAARILKNGCSGADVREMQAGLIRLGHDLGRWGADGDFGDATEMALRRFQRDHALEADGEFGPLTAAALREALAALEGPGEDGEIVEIVGGNCYVRSAPNISGAVLGVAKNGERLEFGGIVDEASGWLAVKRGGVSGWVSCKYGRLAKA